MSTAPFIDGDPTGPDGAWLVAYGPDGQRHYIATVIVEPDGINDPIAMLDGQLLDMDPDPEALTARLAAAFAADPDHWPAGARLHTNPTEAVRFDYRTRQAMAEVIHQADKDRCLDSSPSWVRDRYMILAEAALRYAADQIGVAVIAPVHAGIRGHTVAVGYPDDPTPPRGHEPLFRVVATHEPNPTAQVHG